MEGEASVMQLATRVCMYVMVCNYSIVHGAEEPDYTVCETDRCQRTAG